MVSSCLLHRRKYGSGTILRPFLGVVFNYGTFQYFLLICYSLLLLLFQLFYNTTKINHGQALNLEKGKYLPLASLLYGKRHMFKARK